MGLQIGRGEEAKVETYEVTERLVKTEDDRVVAEGDPDGRWLYAIPGQRIPLEEAERYGLVKAKSKAADKTKSKAADKSAGDGDDDADEAEA